MPKSVTTVSTLVTRPRLHGWGKNISRHKWELDRTLPIAYSVYTGKTIQKRGVSGRTLLPKKGPWGEGEMETDAILTGGSVYSPADAVRPGALSAAEVCRRDGEKGISHWKRQSSTRARRMDCRWKESSDFPCHCEPGLVVAFWKRDCRKPE